MEELVPSGNGKRTVLNINTSDRHLINKLHKNHYKVIWREPASEIENHADIHCFEAKFQQILFTS